MASDALVSVGVRRGWACDPAGQNWLWIDPVVSLVINAIIVWGTWGLLRDFPSACRWRRCRRKSIPPPVREPLVRPDGRRGTCMTLHIWPMSTTENALHMPSRHAGRPSGRRVSQRAVQRSRRALQDQSHDRANRGSIRTSPALLAPDEVVLVAFTRNDWASKDAELIVASVSFAHRHAETRGRSFPRGADRACRGDAPVVGADRQMKGVALRED